jgi:hypothetical protein
LCRARPSNVHRTPDLEDQFSLHMSPS